jgi:hypothetical protein
MRSAAEVLSLGHPGSSSGKHLAQAEVPSLGPQRASCDLFNQIFCAVQQSEGELAGSFVLTAVGSVKAEHAWNPVFFLTPNVSHCCPASAEVVKCVVEREQRLSIGPDDRRGIEREAESVTRCASLGLLGTY